MGVELGHVRRREAQAEGCEHRLHLSRRNSTDIVVRSGGRFRKRRLDNSIHAAATSFTVGNPLQRSIDLLNQRLPSHAQLRLPVAEEHGLPVDTLPADSVLTLTREQLDCLLDAAQVGG